MATNWVKQLRVGNVLDDGDEYKILKGDDIVWAEFSPGTFWEAHTDIPITRYMMKKLGVKSELKITDEFTYRVSDQKLYFKGEPTSIKIDSLHILQNICLDLGGIELNVEKIL